MPSPEPIPGKCGAKVMVRVDNKKTDELAGYCTRWPMKGQARCKMHGAGAKQNVQAGLARYAEQKAERKLERWLSTQDIAPLDDYLGTWERIMAEEVARRDWYYAQERRLAAQADLTITTKAQGEQARAMVVLAERATERAHKLILDYARLGIDERRLQLDKARLRLEFDGMVAAFEVAFDAVYMSERDRATFKAALHEALR